MAMAFLQKGPEPKTQWIFRPLFLLFIWGLLALLLIINGIYEAKRLKDNLHRMLLMKGRPSSPAWKRAPRVSLPPGRLWKLFPRPPLSSYLPLESPSPGRFRSRYGPGYCLPDRSRIGRPAHPKKSQLAKIGKTWHFSCVKLITPRRSFIYQSPKANSSMDDSFYRPLLEGKAAYAIRRSEKMETGQMDSLSLAIVRKAGEGILALQVDEPAIRLFRRRVVLQGLIEEWKGKGRNQLHDLPGGRPGDVG